MWFVQLKAMPMKALRKLEWYCRNPREPAPWGLYVDKLKDRLTFGWLSRKWMGGIAAMHTASEWFRFAATAIMIRPTLGEAYFQRAVNGTILRGDVPSSRHRYRGFDCEGREIEYGRLHGIVDTEILLRLQSTHSAARLLQGVLLGEAVADDQTLEAREVLLLARNLITRALVGRDIPQYLRSRGIECNDLIKHKLG